MKVLLLGFCSLQSLGYLRTAKYNENMEVNLDWKNLRFGYVPTDYNVRCYYRNGEWGEIEQTSDVTIPLHMAASCLHYGQECFEGLKAFRCPD